MKKTLMAFSAALLVLAGSSCKKDGNDCELNAGNFEGTYKVSSVKYKASSSTPETDITTTVFETCELDNLHIFNGGGVYKYQVAGIACSPEDDNYTDSWSISGTTVTVEGEPATITSFSCDGFTASTTDFFTAGDRYTINFVKQ